MRPAPGRPDAPGEPAVHLDLHTVNGCVDIAPDGTTQMLLWDTDTAIVLHCAADGTPTSALVGAYILTQVSRRLELELREQNDRSSHGD